MTGKMHTIGTRAQVWHGTSKKTSGGLTKSDLMMNKHGRIVSRAKHATAKKEMRLVKAGYGTKKGKFGFVKLGSSKSHKSKKHKSRKMRGGHYGASNYLSPAGIDGQGITNYGSNGSNDVQLAAGMAGGRRRSRGMAGGHFGASNYLSPAGIDGQGITNYGSNGSNDVQFAAGMAGGRRRKGRGRARYGGTGFAPALAATGSTAIQMRAANA
jgi:hypothetical protein